MNKKSISIKYIPNKIISSSAIQPVVTSRGPEAAQSTSAENHFHFGSVRGHQPPSYEKPSPIIFFLSPFLATFSSTQYSQSRAHSSQFNPYRLDLSSYSKIFVPGCRVCSGLHYLCPSSFCTFIRIDLSAGASISYPVLAART